MIKRWLGRGAGSTSPFTNVTHSVEQRNVTPSITTFSRMAISYVLLMLSVIVPSVVVLSIRMLSVVMLSVITPYCIVSQDV